MNESEAEFQASKLLDFVKRGGSGRQWWASKSFTGREEREILRAYHDLVEARTRREVLA